MSRKLLAQTACFSSISPQNPKTLNITRINNHAPITTKESARSKTDRISTHRRNENGSHPRAHEIVPVADLAVVDAYGRASTNGCADNAGIDTHIPPQYLLQPLQSQTEHNPPQEGRLLYPCWLHISRRLWVSPVLSASSGCCRTVSCTAVTRLITRIGN